MPLACLALPAQGQLMEVFGVVRDYVSGDTLLQPRVLAYAPGDRARYTVQLDSNGHYLVGLDDRTMCMVEFQHAGFHPKAVEIDMRIPDSVDVSGGYGMRTDVTLMPVIDGLDMSGVPKVFGKSRYDPATDIFAWDLEYTEQARILQAAAFREFDERRKKALKP